jgi:membrane associated rhomboid family serine protease
MSQVPGIDDTLLRAGSYALLALALVVSAAVLTRLSDEDGLLDSIRDRWVYGIPWGTAVVVVAVSGFYYLVQGGGQSGGPLVTAFRSWSLFAPGTILFSSFAHANESHLIGNLFGTVAFAPLVEFAWGHYADGEADSLPQVLSRPPARICLFVLAVFLVGLLGGLVVPGAVIGFSGVVFAFAGFAIVALPIRTVLAMLGISAVRLLWEAVRNPWVVAEGGPQFIRPSWANIALQGHLYGLVVGVLLAVALLRMRDGLPPLGHVWFAALVFAVSRGMDAIYWFLGNETYIRFTALGAAAVLLLATVVAAAAYDGDWQLSHRLDLRLNTAAWGVLLALLIALALVGIPYNLVSVDGGEELDNGVEVRDYTVTYAENVENRYISAPGLPIYQGPTVRESGVIVASESRNIWEVTTSARELAFRGETTVVLGDATWRETVYVNRTEWQLSGGNTTYKVYASPDDEPRRLLFAADPALADPIVNGTRVRIRPTRAYYELFVTKNQSVVGTARIPGDNESVRLGGVEFERDGRTLLARHGGTELQIAEYRLRRR